jgi:hypothetical protein
MISDPKFFAREYIDAHKFNAPAVLAEQALHCLELVSELVSTGLSFQFKGGNSLLIILQDPQRFSIDVDIATHEPRERIEECLNRLVKDHGVFTKWDKRQHKTKPWLPIASYYLFYKSRYEASEEPNIMLDVQLRRSPYKTEQKPVRCLELYQTDVSCELPLPASIIGDKLLTLGPTTLGIPVGKGKETQRLKHVFDIARLLQSGPDLIDIRESFRACITHEEEIQKRCIPEADILRDTLDFCASTARYPEQPAVSPDMMPIVIENIVGIEPFRNHLFSKQYSWQQLGYDLSRVALCIAAVCTDAVSSSHFADALAGRARPDQKFILGTGIMGTDSKARYCWEMVNGWLSLRQRERV